MDIHTSDRVVGTTLMLAVLIAGVAFFASGFLFLSLLDTAFRLGFGAVAVIGSAVYLWTHRHV